MSAGTLGTCAKLQVRCTIVTPDGSRFVGENWCAHPQPACPRAPGEGYEKCKTVCGQIGHAEEVAVMLAGDAARGSHAYVENHTYACRNCQEVLFGEAGIKALTIGAPPEKT
jgi:deoxycytidylate deaminase